MTEYDWIKVFLAGVAFMWVGVAIACWAERRTERREPSMKWHAAADSILSGIENFVGKLRDFIAKRKPAHDPYAEPH